VRSGLALCLQRCGPGLKQEVSCIQRGDIGIRQADVIACVACDRDDGGGAILDERQLCKGVDIALAAALKAEC